MKDIRHITANSGAAVTEKTEAGAQIVIEGYRPPSQRERLERMAALPLTPKRPCIQKPCNIGLFDEDARNQMDLF